MDDTHTPDPAQADGHPPGARASQQSALKFKRLFESHLLGILLADIHGTITDANEAFLEMVGYRREDLPLRWDAMTPPEWRAVDRAVIEESLTTGVGLPYEKEYLSKDGRRVPILIGGVFLEGTEGDCLCIVVDLTEQKDAQAELENFFALSLDLFCIAGVDGYFKRVNSAFEETLGYTADELLGRPFFDFVHPEDRAVTRAEVEKLAAGTPTVHFENRYRCQDGSYRWLAWTSRPTPEGALYAVARDVTESKHAEQELRRQQEDLRRLASELVLAEEKTRRVIGRDLHDLVVQQLAMTRTRVTALLPFVADDALSGSLREIRGLLEQAIETTRSLTYELGAPILQEFGLEAALESLGEDMALLDGFSFHYETDGQPKPLAEDTRIVLYRVARELLFNVVKHARAHSVQMALRRVGDHLEFTLEDDGVGFDATGFAQDLSQSRGFGLFSVRQQLEQFGGHLAVETPPGGGTRLVVVAPLADGGSA